MKRLYVAFSVRRFLPKSRLVVGAVGAIALFSSSPVSSKELDLSKWEMINTMIDSHSEAQEICFKTKLIKENASISQMCSSYSELAPLYIEAARYCNSNYEVYPYYMQFLDLSKQLSETFMGNINDYSQGSIGY